MTTSTDIANMALARLGEGRIMSLDENSAAARACQTFYPHTRDEVLRSHRWNFAQERRVLSRLEEDPPFGWDCQYQLPADFLRVLEVNGTEWANEDTDRWKIEGGKLLSNDTTLELVYVKRVTDTAKFDPLFSEVLTLKLAAKIASTRRGSSSQVANFLEEYAKLTGPLARRVDANESRMREKLLPTESVFTSLRFGFYVPRAVTSSGSSNGTSSGAAHVYTASEIAALYAVAIKQVTATEITSGAEDDLRTYSPADIVAFIAQHAAGPVAALDGWIVLDAPPADFDAIGTEKTIYFGRSAIVWYLGGAWHFVSAASSTGAFPHPVD